MSATGPQRTWRGVQTESVYTLQSGHWPFVKDKNLNAARRAGRCRNTRTLKLFWQGFVDRQRLANWGICGQLLTSVIAGNQPSEVICPSGYFVAVDRNPKSPAESSRSIPHEGRWPSSRTLGWNAVDAAALGAQVARGRTMLKRTAKSCGPDTPTLGVKPAEDDPAGDGSKRARSPGRARRKPLKPLRREGRVIPVNLW